MDALVHMLIISQSSIGPTSRKAIIIMARDHYVPQFYLRNFQIPRKPRLVYLYRRGKPAGEISIRKVAHEEDYYDLKRDDPEVDKDAIDADPNETAVAGRVVKQLSTGRCGSRSSFQTSRVLPELPRRSASTGLGQKVPARYCN